MDLFHVTVPENTIYAKIITARQPFLTYSWSKVRVRELFWVEIDFFHVKLHEKTIYAKIITALAAVFDLLGVKSEVHFFG